jgi:hypothetical protein
MKSALGRSAVAAFAAVLVALGSGQVTDAWADVSTRADPTWGTDGRVNAILRVGGTVYVGGDFTHVVDRNGNVYPRNRLAAIDPATGAATSWNPNADGKVFNLALSPDRTRLYAVGSFTSIGTVKRKRIAAFDAASGALESWKGPGINNVVRGIATLGNSVYIGGAFTKVAGQPRAHLASLAASSAGLQSWAPTADGLVKRIVTSDTRMYVAGDFGAVNGSTERNMAALDPATGASIPCSCDPGVPVIDMTTDGARLYAAMGGPGGRAQAFDFASGRLLWDLRTDGNVQAVTILGPWLYLGGHFLAVADVTARRLVRVDPATGTLDTSWLPRVNAGADGHFKGVVALSSYGSQLYAGGDFTRVGGVRQLRFAQFSDQAG